MKGKDVDICEQQSMDVGAFEKEEDLEEKNEATGEEKANSSETKHKSKYKDAYPRQMYTFFASFSDVGVPSFSKFARSIGVTLSELSGFRDISEFDRAYRECSEIRRDYLIDNALSKRYDSSFTKYLLSYEYGMDEGGTEDSRIDVTVEVID